VYCGQDDPRGALPGADVLLRIVEGAIMMQHCFPCIRQHAQIQPSDMAGAHLLAEVRHTCAALCGAQPVVLLIAGHAAGHAGAAVWSKDTAQLCLYVCVALPPAGFQHRD